MTHDTRALWCIPLLLASLAAAKVDPREKSPDPLEAIVGKMSTATNHLDELTTGQPVQAKQAEVVAGLDKIIKELQKQSSGGGGSSASPSKPLQTSRVVGGPGGIGDLHDPKAGDKSWGNLPPKQRDQILQAKTEGFPPGYEVILQNYFIRLSQEHTGDDPADAAAGPTTRPGAP